MNKYISKPLKPHIILITSAYHMKRAKTIFQRRGFIVTPYPVDFQSKQIINKSVLLNPINLLPMQTV